MGSPFKDHFSFNPAGYNRYRPGYPPELFAQLSALTPSRRLAWDCATGSGQAALLLAAHFSQVIASDASAAQIGKARQRAGVHYLVAPAERTPFADASLDLITVAQALHWFDLEAFGREVGRLLVAGGLLAVWCYDLLQVDQAVDRVVQRLYGDILEPYWPPERRLVERGYADIRFPFPSLEAGEFCMSQSWDLGQLVGYLGTWSAVNRYREATGEDPLQQISEPLKAAWGEPGEQRRVIWPLRLRLWRKPE